MSAVRAVSLKRPWTELILDGHKPIENRTWHTPHRGLLVVHGSQGWDDRCAETTEPILGGTAANRMRDWQGPWPVGYLGVVELLAICGPAHRKRCDCGPWAFDFAHHWQLARPRRFPAPIPGPGRLGLWTPPAHVLAAVHELEAVSQ